MPARVSPPRWRREAIAYAVAAALAVAVLVFSQLTAKTSPAPETTEPTSPPAQESPSLEP